MDRVPPKPTANLLHSLLLFPFDSGSSQSKQRANTTSADYMMRIMRSVCIGLLTLAVSTGTIGCSSWMNRKKEVKFDKDVRKFRELMEDPDRPRIVGEVASALGLAAKQYDSFGLVHNLPGTGGIVKPGQHREIILSDMRQRDIPNPEKVLDSPETAMVKLQSFANPGDRKNDLLDVSVEVSSECNATDLREGYVLPARLRELVSLDGRLRKSNDKANVSGEVVVFPKSYRESDELELRKGVIIGGAKLLESHKLGLQLDKDYRHVLIVKKIQEAINSRFFFSQNSKQNLVAEGKNDWHIVITMVPKYRLDPAHFMSVIMSTGFNETAEEVAERIEGCRRLLVNRETARRASCELEAIGSNQAKEELANGLNSSDIEVRFHSAYALAYLDDARAVPVLVELAQTQPAFLPLCLVGLSVAETPTAREGLERLLQDPNPEICFGAFWAIRNRNPNDMTVIGETIGDICSFVQVPSSHQLLAVSLQQKKEIVLFGSNTTVVLPATAKPTPSMVLTPMPTGQIHMMKRHSGGETTTATVDSNIAAIVRGMAMLAANYTDIVHTIETLNTGNSLSIPVAMNPRPRAGRIFKRDDVESTLNVDPNQVQTRRSTEQELTTDEKSAWWSMSSWWSKRGKQSTINDEESTENSYSELSDSEGRKSEYEESSSLYE